MSEGHGSMVADRCGWRPMHRDEWWACVHPERVPESGRTNFRPGCLACTVALAAFARQNPEQRMKRSGRTRAASLAFFVGHLPEHQQAMFEAVAT